MVTSSGSVVTITLPSKIKQVSLSLYVQGNSETSQDQIGHEYTPNLVNSVSDNFVISILMVGPIFQLKFFSKVPSFSFGILYL